ncbi:MAG: NAD-dependent malic enzyme [Gammaproteobacteria bacterium]|nr:NAD-dependent malic enzyme [Gammaproteobacteria bacterium]
MKNIVVEKNSDGSIKELKTDLTGQDLLNNYFLNKGTAFSEEEREMFNLVGKLPHKVETIEEQGERCYQQFLAQPTPLAKYVYLDQLHNTNETLYYKVVGDHIEEMMPMVYTPTVGEAIQKFSQEYRTNRGVIISYPEQDKIDAILDEVLNDDIDIIVVTDAEGILGIGDQGVGGINICIGKLAVYTFCADINPMRVLPIMLDVGTNNESMLKDPGYLGWQHPRVEGADYDSFIDKFVQAVHKRLPNIYLHWEDFAKNNARKNLDRYIDKMCTFNDDMQGTGIVTLSGLLSAMVATDQKLIDQRIIFHGAGTSATGIADQIVDAMVLEGLSKEEAESRIWMVGRRGMLKQEFDTLQDFQRPYARTKDQYADWDVADQEFISLEDLVRNAKPTVLIGVSTVANAFNETVVKTMLEHCERPIIFPLSNPTSNAEAKPEDLMKWTNDKAVVATGSPFGPVMINGKETRIAQCNNAFAFPGLGLGIIAAKATRVTKTMIWACCKALTEFSPVSQDKTAPLLPHINDVKKVSFYVAKKVVMQAIEDGVAEPIADIDAAVKSVMWEAKYYPLGKISSTVSCC